MATVVFVGLHDDLPSIRSRIDDAEAGQVILVLPAGYDGLRNPGFLRFLQRHAIYQNKSLALVTTDWITRRLAREVGLPVFRSPSSVRQTALPPVEHPTGAHRLAAMLFARPRIGIVSLVVALALATAAATGTAYAATNLLPAATITLTPAAEQHSETIEIVASVQQSRPEGQRIPARIVSVPVEVSDSRTTTGVRIEQSNRALGEVVFLNISDEPIPIPLDLTVGTARGQQYRVTDFITLEPGEPRRVPVASIQTGAAANADTGTITRILNPEIAARVTVFNDRPVIGGTDRALSIVSAEDQNYLKAELIERMMTLAYERLYAAKRPSESIYPETVHLVIDEEIFDRPIGSESSSVSLQLKGTVTGIAFESSDVNAVAQRFFQSRLRSGTQLVPGSFRTAPLEAFDWTDDSVSFRLLVEWRSAPTVDVERIREEVAGLSTEDAERRLVQMYRLASNPSVVINPSWVTNVPAFGPRVEVKVLNDTN